MATVSSLKNKPAAPAKGRLTRAREWVAGHAHATAADPLVRQLTPIMVIGATVYLGVVVVGNYAMKRIWLG